MARCPFAQWMPISGTCGTFVGGPFRIIHHTTEGRTAAAAFQAFRRTARTRISPSTTSGIYQHIDTSLSPREPFAMLDGGVQTNRYSAIQIEVVGSRSSEAAADAHNVATSCAAGSRRSHQFHRSGRPGPEAGRAGRKGPGRPQSQRDDLEHAGGHYGHSQVPENSHWDPGYTPEEAIFVLRFDPEHVGPRRSGRRRPFARLSRKM